MRQHYPVQRQLLSVAFLLSLTNFLLPLQTFGQAQPCTAPVLVLTSSAPAAVCSPQTVNLNNLIDYSASTLPDDTYFLFYDNNNNQVSNPSAINQSGTYLIKAISGVCSDQKSVTVTINQTPVITTFFSPFCSNDQASFNLNASAGPNTNVIWNGNGVINSNGTYYFQPLSAGAGTFNLRAINTTGGCQASMQVQVLKTPKLVLKTPTPVCSPQTVDLTKLVDPTSILPTGTVLSYFLNNAAVSSPSAVTQSGTYIIVASVLAPGGGASCSDFGSVSVSINQTPVITSFYGPFCSNDQGSFNLNASAGTNTVVWNGDGVNNAGGTYYFQPLAAGAGTHTLVASNITGGCQASLGLTVLQAPRLVVKQPEPVCSPATIDLTTLVDRSASILPPGTTLLYLQNNISISNPSAVSQSGVYQIAAVLPTSNQFTTCSDLQNVLVTVNITPVITTFQGNFCSGIVNELPLQLSSNTGISVIWNGDGVDQVAGSWVFKPASAGIGTHTISAINQIGGCQSSIVETVNQTPKLVLKSPTPVCAPQTVDLNSLIDLTQSVIPTGTVFQYLNGTIPVTSPSAVSQSGFYTIRAISPFACIDQQTVQVDVLPLLVMPSNLFSDYCSTSQKVSLGTQNIPEFGLSFPMWQGAGIESQDGPRDQFFNTPRSWYFNPAAAGAGAHVLTLFNGFSTLCPVSKTVTVHQTPVLVLKTPAPVCAPQTVDLTKLVDQTASILPPGTTFLYFGPFSNTTPVASPSAVTQSGTYTIRAIPPFACFSEQNVNVEIDAPGVIPLNLLTDYCSTDQKVSLGTQNIPEFGISFPMWQGAGIESQDGPRDQFFNTPRSWYFNPAAAGAGQHVLTMYNGFSASCPTFKTVTVHQTPVLVLKTPAPVCAPQTVDLTKLVDPAASTIPTGTLFQYLIGNALVSSPSAVSQTGTYTVKAIGPFGCISQQNVFIEIDAPPVLPNIATTYCSTDARIQLSIQSVSGFGNSIPMWQGDGLETQDGQPDNFGNLQRTWYFNPAAAGQGTHVLTMYNGFSISCPVTMSVTVKPPPTLSSCPADITVTNDPGACGAIVNYTAPVFTAGCGNAVLSQTGPASGSLFPTGTTTITFKLKDASGNTLSTCSFNVIVNDTEKPVITCNAEQNLNNDPNQCGAKYNGVPPATDNCPGATVTGSRSDARSLTDLYPIGSTTITWTATDASGNTSTCIQKINVADHELPAITCPANISQDADAGSCGAIIIVTTPVATDNCGTPVVSSHRSDGLGPNTSYPIGVTTITWTATDAAGNTKSCTQTITVRDNEAPVINCSAAILVSTDPARCTASVTVPLPTATDNCGTPSVTGVRSDGQALNAAYPRGITTITWTATDASGRTNSCTQTVTVADKEKPAITAPPAVNTTADRGKCSAVVSLGSPVTSDNCGVATVGNNAPATFPVGVTTVTWNVMDVNGNINSASQTITVTDNEKPVVTGSVQNSFCNGGSGSYAVDPVTATDNCGIASIVYSISGATVRSGTGNNASGSFAVGVSTVVWTVKDVNGNVSTWQTKVVVDNAIVLSIPDAFALPTGTAANTVYLGYSPASSIKLKAVATGGTGILSYLWSNGATTQTITVSPTVNTTYSVTVTDATGCSKIASRQVIVINISCGTNKVTICCKSGSSQTPQTLCVNTNLVPYYLLAGANLGSCISSPLIVRVQDKPAEGENMHSLSMQAFPNPSHASFTLVVKGMKPVEKAELVIYDVVGRVIEMKTVSVQSFSVGGSYIPGVYVAELRQGDKTTTLKLVKQ